MTGMAIVRLGRAAAALRRLVTRAGGMSLTTRRILVLGVLGALASVASVSSAVVAVTSGHSHGSSCPRSGTSTT
jgi:hypothetical protein